MFIKNNHDVLFDTIIVGAGLSGLRTAMELINVHGVDRNRILIIEAQDYIGGRVRQADDFVPNGLIELGAEILHGEQTLLTQFAKEQGEEIKPIYCWAHGDGGPMEEPVDGAYGLYYMADSQRVLRFDTTDGDFQHLNKVLRELPLLHPDDIAAETSLLDFLAERHVTPEMLRLGRAGYANTSCANLDTLSLKQVVSFSRQWDTEGEGDGDFKYARTFKCLLDFFKQHLADRVLLSCPAQTVTRLPNQTVRVDARDGRVFHAKTIVVTSSIHVLQRPELLTFQPPLPAVYAQSIQHAVMQRAMKIFVQFSAAVWPVGLQGMIMAPPAEEEAAARPDDRSAPFYHVPECWFTALPCAEHRALYTAEDVAARHHVAGGCARCSYYCVGFVTSQFADRLDSLPEDADVCDVLVKQLDRVVALFDESHWLSPQQHAAQLGAAPLAAPTTPLAPSEKDAATPPPAPTAAAAAAERALPRPSDVFVKGRVQRWTPGRHPYIGGGYASALATAAPVATKAPSAAAAGDSEEKASHGSEGTASPATSVDSDEDAALSPLDYARIFGEKAVDGVLFFAGEGVNYPAGGTAHAALESGVRVAQLVRDALATHPSKSRRNTLVDADDAAAPLAKGVEKLALGAAPSSAAASSTVALGEEK
eukprot:gene12058-8614_t